MGKAIEKTMLRVLRACRFSHSLGGKETSGGAKESHGVFYTFSCHVPSIISCVPLTDILATRLLATLIFSEEGGINPPVLGSGGPAPPLRSRLGRPNLGGALAVTGGPR